MNFLSTYRLNFADLPSSLVDSQKSKVRIVPLPYEATVTYKGGTKEAPFAIITASQNLELWDEELGAEPCEVGIFTLAPFKCSSSGPKEAVKEICSYVEKIWDSEKFYIFIGGEHTVSAGIVKALSKIYSSLSVLCLDAHADLRNVYEGSPYNHACAMRRVKECSFSLVELGLRSFSKEEAEYLKREAIPYQTSFQVLQSDSWKNIIREHLSEFVYVTVDVDVMDPSFMPSVGTPEPGGLDWYKILEIIRFTARHKKIVGADIVEFSPLAGVVAPDFLVAKLIYKIIGYRFFLK